MGTKQMICRSFIHSYYCGGLLQSPPQICAAPVSPKPSAADYVPSCKGTYVQKVVELGLIATEVEYPLLRACSSSAALRAAGLHTHVRTHRTSSDPAYLHTYVYLYMREEERGCGYFWSSGLKRTLGNGFTVSPKP